MSATSNSDHTTYPLDLAPELLAQLEEAAREHHVAVADLMVEVLGEYVRWERLARLRGQSDVTTGPQDFTSWAEQVEFFHARLRQRAAAPAGLPNRDLPAVEPASPPAPEH
ncbi:hypothetical protein [Corynebacterium sp. 13CS0277]|uniref:hypothetical protein n=1 Tax=Corynebacterium sp. 13CS0277 TaxID=2071994 RepID=UPI0011B1EE35|nr:hypothetical protein [Corynebacterium sp. 13CS0277]